MATRQSLRGSTEKIYEIVNTFNKGYNTSVADDILQENYFRDINNFIPSDEGNITKRPGIHKVGFYEFFSELLNNKPAYDILLEVSGSTNDASITPTTLQGLGYLFGQLFQMSNLVKTRTETIDGSSQTVRSEFIPDNLANFTIFNDNNLMTYINDFKSTLTADELYQKTGDISFCVIFTGKYKETYGNNTLLETTASRIIKVKIMFDYDSTDINRIRINYEIRQPLRNASTERLAYRYEGDDIIEFTTYADNYYYMNSYDAIVKVEREIHTGTTLVAESIMETYTDASNIYEPVAIEVKNVGFNILASNPIEFIDNQGSANSIRGVFYTYENQPTQTIPYNKEFKIHILASGTGEMQTPQYRQNNGEIDVEINPYKDLPGSYNTERTIFTCTGLNETGSIEIKLTKGTGNTANEFLAYAETGSVIQNEIGRIEDTSRLILSSRYCKVINNQLVLFGNHGYIFFSDYDNFNYFPNYYYVYVAETEDEKVVSINYFRQYYAIFTNHRLKRMTGAFGSDDFGVYPLNDFIGCINPRSIKQIQNYLYFLSHNGLYMLKQGYVGEGTENVEQIDLPIYKSYLAQDMLKAVSFQNYYALVSKSEAILYNYVNDAYYKFKNASNNGSTTNDETLYPSEYTIPFQYTKYQSGLFYGIKETIDANTKSFDICIQDFSAEALEITDNGISFVSSFETPFMSFNSPTNTKKFKSIYIKLYNKYGKYIPLYVTIKVDDRVVISPDNYVVSYDEDTNTYYYDEKIESNKTLKGYRPLGEMILGEDVIGERTLQILKMKVGAKGRAIKIIISDGIEEGNEGYEVHQNNYRFDLATLGVVYKLKKVKEG